MDETKTDPKQRKRTLQRVRRANDLVKQAGKIVKGERKCNGRVKLKADMKRRVAPDNPYLLNADGSVQTRPCTNPPIKGGTVCPVHGGRAPQVRKNANRRLLAMVEPSLVRLEALIHQDEHMPTALGAIRTVLERAGAQALGPLKTESGEDNSRPVIQIGIQVGGIEPDKVAAAVQVNNKMLAGSVEEAEVVE